MTLFYNSHTDFIILKSTPPLHLPVFTATEPCVCLHLIIIKEILMDAN